MFALTSNRFYCYYPGLFARKEYVSIRRLAYSSLSYSVPSHLPFHNFNYGVTNVNRHHSVCDDGCSVVWRTSGLVGVGVARWGGLDRSRIIEVDVDDEFFADRSYMWKVDNRDCSNALCPNAFMASDLQYISSRD